MIVETLNITHAQKCADIAQRLFKFPWSESQFADHLEHKNQNLGLFDLDKNLVGFCLFLKQYDECEILDLGIDLSYQQKGNAQILLNSLFEICRKEDYTQISLEVDATNSVAIALYIKNDFAQVGYRKEYYRDGHDAILMTKTLHSESHL